MRITVNGETRELSDDATVAELIAEMNLQPRQVAVERNKELVPRSRHAETPLSEGDNLEVVTLVGGG
ncbi:MAG: sulfur carrier protein ThiS [Planctomycetota bacterium]